MSRRFFTTPSERRGETVVRYEGVAAVFRGEDDSAEQARAYAEKRQREEDLNNH